MNVPSHHTQCLLLLLFSWPTIVEAFSPDYNDYDAYGIKIAVNDIIFMQAKNQDHTYFIQFAPFDNTQGPLQCSLNYLDPSHYIYAVGVGSSQALTSNPYVYYAGEVANLNGDSTDNNSRRGTFIIVLINRDSTSIQSYIASGTAHRCDKFFAQAIQFLSTYDHQEYFVIAVEPLGRYAIGLATEFVFQYQPFENSTMTSKSTITVWPSGSTFHPCAADASETFTIVAGFVKNLVESRVRATPTVHLLSNSNLTVLSSWTYTAPDKSWQSYLTYSGIDYWSKKFTMSVKINGADSTRVLIGMPFLNTVFLFVVRDNGTVLDLASSTSYNKSVGFGKGVTWLSSTQAAILYSAYSPDFTTWYSSKVYVYTDINSTDLPASPTAVIPNAQQPVPLLIKANFIQLISSPSSLAILDQVGGVMLILSEPAGFYASTDTTQSALGAVIPAVSHASPCIGGTFKPDSGVHPCSLCPRGSRNPGGAGATMCMNCSIDAFCPLGAVYEVEKASLMSLSQAVPYPRSPDLTVYEDLLINNMVTFGSTLHCLRVSPMFWSVILMGIALAMLLGMASLNLCVNEPRRTEWRAKIKRVFLRTDLVVSNTMRSDVALHLLDL